MCKRDIQSNNSYLIYLNTACQLEAGEFQIVLEQTYDMAFVSSKKREAGQWNRRCLTLHKQIKKLDVAKKRKISYREKAEQFEI